MSTRSMLLGLMLLMASTPAAMAEWKVHGSVEPDTTYDMEGYMFTEPDWSNQTELKQVYFNAFRNYYTSSLNPNVPEVGSRLIWFPYQNPGAYLGFWKDCNKDGYIGMAAGALTEYRAELLTTHEVCAPATYHNDAQWVYEFVWIASNFTPASRGSPQPRAVVDHGAFMWGDMGLPGEDALGHVAPCEFFQGGSITNVATPPFQGWSSSTGPLIQWTDCWTGHSIARAITQADPTGQLGFDDPTRPQDDPDSLLIQHLPVHLFYDPNQPEGNERGLFNNDRDDPAFTVWDCSDPHGGPADATPTPAPALNDPTGNWYGALWQAEEGLSSPSHNTTVSNDRLPKEGRDNCEEYGTNPTTGAPVPPHAGAVMTVQRTVESGPMRDYESVGARRYNDYAFYYLKHQTDAWHMANNETRNAYEGCTQVFANICPETLTNPALAPLAAPLREPLYDLTAEHPLGKNTPTNGGLDPLRFNALVGPSWSTGFRSGQVPIMDRHSLEPAGPQYETFYVRLGAASFAEGAKVPGNDVYGREWCDSFPSTGVVRQFDCDKENWWNVSRDPLSRANGNGDNDKDLDGNDKFDGAYPGWPYHLRDIDCYDNTLARDAPVGLVTFSRDGPCEWPDS